jgi:hypothetical protein
MPADKIEPAFCGKLFRSDNAPLYAPDLSDPDARRASPSILLDRGPGPDVEWVEKIDYKVDLGRADGFYAAIRAYWHDLWTVYCNPPFRDKTKNRPAWRVRNRLPRPIGERAWGARLD